MRIALFSEVLRPRIDGITDRLSQTLPELLRLGHEVTVFAPGKRSAQRGEAERRKADGSPQRSEAERRKADGSAQQGEAERGHEADGELPGVRVIRVPSLPFPPYPGLEAALPDPRIVAELFALRPDVVHAVGPVCLGAWGALGALALGLPLVASFHTDLARYLAGYRLASLERALWAWLGSVHGLAHVNLCPSPATQRVLALRGIPRVDIWQGGVDAQRFHPEKRSLAMRDRLSGGRPDLPLLLYVGRLAREKGIESLAWVMDELPEARLALVGDGPDRVCLERVFAKLPVHFAGFLTGEELAEAYASADVFVMPSMTETLGFVVLEALASGVPVVAADAGGLRGVVRDGENGLLYDPTRRKAALAPIRELLASRGLRMELARMGRKTAENASWEAETLRLVRAYELAIERTGASLPARLWSLWKS